MAGLAAWRAEQSGAAPLAQLEARMLHRAGIWAYQAGLQQRDRSSGGPLVEKAIDYQQRAQELWSLLPDRETPTVLSEQSQGGVSLCLALQRMGRLDEACDAIAAAIPLLERLAVDFPHSQRRRSELGNARVNYASMLGQFERFEECTRQLELGMVTWRELVREAPQNDDFALGLAHTLQTRATLMFYSGDATAAGALFTEAG
jgi:hypothetical protein